MRTLLVLALCAGCYGFGDDDANGLGTGGGAGSAGGAGGGSGATGGTSGLPCDVAGLMASRCTSCHSSPPSGGAPMALLSYADLTRPAISDPTQKEADVCLTRMQSSTAPMPPAPAAPATAAEIATLQTWIAAGYPMGSCGTPDGGGGGDPYGTPTVCTSGTHWTLGNEGSSRMRPGEACVACHRQSGGEAPLFAIAGTVYPTAHEPNDCNGAGGISVVIIDGAGRQLTLPTNSAGNFYSQTAIVTPYQAKVVANGRERVMSAAQTSGDCNSCHTESGANNAPGRIMAP